MRRSIAYVCLLLAASCSHADPSAPPPPASSAAAPSPASAPVAPTAPAAPAAPYYRVPIDGLPAIGSARALVTVVELCDYQCPFCRRAQATIAKLRADYGDDLRVVLVQRPLPMHDRARPAALAALAANEQGKLAAMHDRLFALEGKLDDAALTGAARDAGLDMERFERDRKSAGDALAAQEQLADRLGVHGTPSFFVNGRSLLGAQPYDVFKRVIDEQLAGARALTARGVLPDDVYGRVIAGGLEKLVEQDESAAGTCGGKACDGKETPPVGDKIEAVPTDGAPSRGAAWAPITVVEFADFQCPYCAKAEATVHALEAAHPGDVRVVFKNLPLPFHDHARLAAKAAIAADVQGKYWPMHDRLYAAGAPADRAALDAIAQDIGLDVARFERDLDAPSTEARVAADEADARALDVKGTPTFFVNGHRVIGAQPLATFEAAIAKK